MSNTVFIFGAGASFDAGIPLLSNFVQTMWEIAIRSKYNDIDLKSEEVEVFKNAIKVRNELDTYHGRANFNDRNIEDILSILSFNLFDNKKIDKDRFNWIIEAIVKTIDLTCKVQHTGLFKRIEDDNIIYNRFWKSIFKDYKRTNIIPTIVTFNYDLVLERSLFQVLNNKHYNSYDNRLPFDKISINYYHKHLNQMQYIIDYINYQDSNFKPIRGTILKHHLTDDSCNIANIDLLKLHGSINFPNKKIPLDNFNLAQPVENPFIMPPIYNKMQNEQESEVWRIALNKLREAVNICIVGYSMPQTDIYMKYFLKSALGPNINLNNIFVFNPVFEAENELSHDMKKRYDDCFSPQLHERILYNPYPNMARKGTFEHFISIINDDPRKLIF